MMNLFLLASGFIAGLVDSIGGGGGLISVPAFLAAGIPNAFLLGTNKFMSACGTSVSVIRYARAGLLPSLSFRKWAALVLSAFLFAAAGAVFSQFPFVLEHLGILVPVMLFAVMAFLVKRWFWDQRNIPLLLTSQADSPARISQAPSVLAVGFIGGYDGLFGPGAGTFYLSFLEKLGFSTVTANAITKILNLSSNFGALLYFVIRGRVMWPVAASMAVAYMAGNFLGSGMVLKRGQSLVRVTVLTMTTLLLIKYLWQHHALFIR